MPHGMPNSDHAIVVERLSKRYGALLAVDDVSFSVAKGEVFAFLGPNGAGKSTTAEIIETIRTPTAGRVTVLGMDVTRSKAKVVRRIGVLPQGFSSFDRITVRESLSYYARVFGCKADVDALKGWRRQLFGEDALKLKRGEIALSAKGSAVRVVKL